MWYETQILKCVMDLGATLQILPASKANRMVDFVNTNESFKNNDEKQLYNDSVRPHKVQDTVLVSSPFEGHC